MENERKDNIYDELVAHLTDMSTPIDFDALEAGGMIAKEGSWYRVSDAASLPKHVAKKIKEMMGDNKGIKVKFYSHKRYSKMVEKYL